MVEILHLLEQEVDCSTERAKNHVPACQILCQTTFCDNRNKQTVRP